MEQLAGKSIFKAIAIGPICFYEKSQTRVTRSRVDNVEAEIRRFVSAKDKALDALSKLYTKAFEELGESGAGIFEVHMMMIEDEDYIDSIYNIIKGQEVNAEYAVATTGDNFAAMFAAMDGEYMQSKAIDVKDISERLINVLSGTDVQTNMDKPVILMAEDLVPSETVQIDKSKLLAFVTELGSVNSHTAILARTMGIPALIGVKIDKKYNGKIAIVDGNTGTFIIEPTKEVLEKYQRKKAIEEQNKTLLQELKGKNTVTKDGKEIKLYANIGNVGDVAGALANDAGGIGLFRSEFLYLEATDYPTEEEQFKAYKTVAENMAGKKVIIRTLDIGADKQADYFHLENENNPAMGFRAIRICLSRPDIFKTQLRAILRASVYGTISIMFPMIISVWEVQKIKEILDEVKAELSANNIPYKNIEIGIMIETPAAVMISDFLAKEVDFFSIGTNDLTQYTLAIDRQNQTLDMFYDAHHEAVLRMIELVVKNGHKENIWVGICGELGADMDLTERFIKMGIDELSVSASYILPIRKKIGEVSYKG